MRGKLPCLAAWSGRSRIIPAHAGQTVIDSAPILGPPDHPRACGANSLTLALSSPNTGSSPRMRGKLGVKYRRDPVFRIIPAHAGQTVLLAFFVVVFADHPRACGANGHVGGFIVARVGSSPRMRGKPQTAAAQEFQRRIIPAHAGQTQFYTQSQHLYTDHPRACGANLDRKLDHAAVLGSSPRMRGKQSDFMRKLLSAGPSIIGFAQWLQSSYYCSCLQSSAKTPISRGTTPTSLFLGFQNSITLLLLT